MKVEDFAPITRAELGSVHWRGKRRYRVLSHSFSIRWSGDLSADRVEHVWGSFAIPDVDRSGYEIENGELLYSLVDLGSPYPRRFRLLLGNKQLISSRSPDDVVSHLLWQIFQRMHEDSKEFLLIHAGSVVSPHGDGVLLPAASGFGKTTLVAGLIRGGFGFLSDEIGVIDPRRGRLLPYPRALNLKEGSFGLFPDLLSPEDIDQRDGYIRADEIRFDAMADPCAVRFVIAPRYERGVPTATYPLTPAATVKELWTNGVNLHQSAGRGVRTLAEIANGAKGYRLVSGNLDEAVRVISDLTASA